MATADTPYIRLTALQGRPVVTESGDAELHVTDVQLDEDERTASRLLLAHGGLLGRSAGRVAMDRVDHIGPDAVVVSEVTADGADEEDAALRRTGSVVERTTMTDEGAKVGHVTDVVLRTTRGRTKAVAVELRTDDGQRYLVLDDAVKLFGDVVLVPAAAARHLLESPEQVAEAIDG